MTKTEARAGGRCDTCCTWSEKKQRCLALNGTDQCPREAQAQRKISNLKPQT